MSNKKLIKIIGVSSILFSTVTLAASSISKDEWLTAFKEYAPSKMCRNLVDDPDTNNLLQKANVSYEKCVTLLPASFDKCKTKFYSELPAKIDDKSSSTWGKKIGNCIGIDFYTNNLGSVSKSTPSSTPTATTQTDKTSSAIKQGEMTKEEWLKALTLVAPKLICDRLMSDQSLHKKLTKNGISSEKCLSLMPNSISACEKKLSSQVPATLEKKNQEKWNRAIGKCIGQDFAKHYLN